MNNNITGLFVTYEIALKLKEKGFNEQCLAFFNGVGDDMLQPIDTDFINFREIGECVAAPLWEQVINWLRISHNMRISNTFITWRLAELVKCSLDRCHWFLNGENGLFDDVCEDDYNIGREKIILKALEKL